MRGGSALAFVVLIIVAVSIGIIGERWLLPSSMLHDLDKAQAAFEKRERVKSSSYDFDAWRKAGDLKCFGTPSLRICQAMPVLARSHAGEEVYVARDFMSFACSTSECAWVDP